MAGLADSGEGGQPEPSDEDDEDGDDEEVVGQGSGPEGGLAQVGDMGMDVETDGADDVSISISDELAAAVAAHNAEGSGYRSADGWDTDMGDGSEKGGVNTDSGGGEAESEEGDKEGLLGAEAAPGQARRRVLTFLNTQLATCQCRCSEGGDDAARLSAERVRRRRAARRRGRDEDSEAEEGLETSGLRHEGPVRALGPGT